MILQWILSRIGWRENVQDHPLFDKEKHGFQFPVDITLNQSNVSIHIYYTYKYILKIRHGTREPPMYRRCSHMFPFKARFIGDFLLPCFIAGYLKTCEEDIRQWGRGGLIWSRSDRGMWKPHECEQVELYIYICIDKQINTYMCIYIYI